MCTFQRRNYFTSFSIVEVIRAQILRTAAANDVEIIAYCFMPDHVHGLVAGCTEQADVRKFVTRFRQQSGLTARQTRGGRLWQEGFFDRVLRDDESTFDVVSYILANPVRAGLCRDVTDYPYSGSSRHSLTDMALSVQWKPTSLG
jgi:putative transposase